MFRANCLQSRLILNRLLSTRLPPPERDVQLPVTKLFINNEWVNSQNGQVFETINPTTEECLAELQRADKDDVDKAVQAAKEAFRVGSPWRTTEAYTRGRLLNRLADLIERDAIYLASLETHECGKPYAPTYRNDIPSSVKFCRYFGSIADKHLGNTIPVDQNYFSCTFHEPVGVCALITAWNFSVVMICSKIAPALAAGCTMVVKPSQHSCLGALHLARLTKEAGFPDGVINFVTGCSDVGDHLCEHKDVDKISFTGSTQVGQKIMQKANLKRLTLNLSGKSPIIILDDADLESAVEAAHTALFYNNGQCCCAGSRTFVHESLYKKFIERSKEKIRTQVIGDPLDQKVDQGPQATKDQMETILNYIDTGIKEGAKLEIGGGRLDRRGFFVEPTLFSDLDDRMTISNEEIFGPVQQVYCFRHVDEAIARANDSKYGLAASVFGKDIHKINKISNELRAGSVWVNCHLVVTPYTPFGGYKMSGLGREGCWQSLEAYTELKAITIKC